MFLKLAIILYNKLIPKLVVSHSYLPNVITYKMLTDFLTKEMKCVQLSFQYNIEVYKLPKKDEGIELFFHCPPSTHVRVIREISHIRTKRFTKKYISNYILNDSLNPNEEALNLILNHFDNRENFEIYYDEYILSAYAG